MRPEVDEIIPVSRGGNPLDIDNCQLTHRFCNRRKSDKVLTKKVRLSSAVGSVTTSRQW
jgi:5-methylcytosine-specific restriction endonuclease McrA